MAADPVSPEVAPTTVKWYLSLGVSAGSLTLDDKGVEH